MYAIIAIFIRKYDIDTFQKLKFSANLPYSEFEIFYDEFI